jgi:hypothetical protein
MLLASSQSVPRHACRNRSRAEVPGQCAEMMSAITGTGSSMSAWRWMCGDGIGKACYSPEKPSSGSGYQTGSRPPAVRVPHLPGVRGKALWTGGPLPVSSVHRHALREPKRARNGPRCQTLLDDGRLRALAQPFTCAIALMRTSSPRKKFHDRCWRN